MLDQKLAEAMQRVLAKAEERFNLTKALEDLIDFGIGTRQGKSAYFTTKNSDAAIPKTSTRCSQNSNNNTNRRKCSPGNGNSVNYKQRIRYS